MKNDTFKYTTYSVYVCKLSTSSTMYLNIPNELLIHVGDPHNKHLHISICKEMSFERNTLQ